ncbi:cysteine proteinase [Dendrothele bispora CBS 962.96]|uniref:Cysteine proteinase n=1 Tax=Dendrothele bispora (strain CBS 962.96) TaxID=1314807 RepID=A0A4S8MSM9_DENBC|nr:cysteine proteinase [Dendrothele bispora CBS 962.96]
MYTKATQAELAKDFDNAYRLYIKAAELFLHLSGSTSDDTKSKWNSSARRSLERAEKLNAVLNKPSQNTGQSQSGYQLTPVAVDHFSVQEQAHVVRRGATVNGTTYLPWDDQNYNRPRSSHRIIQPALSALQKEMGALWQSIISDDLDSLDPHDTSVLPQHISQNIVTDCSLCASISVCLEHKRRYRSNLAESVLHPNTSQGGGIYDLKVLFNGTWRRVTIDNKLPYHPRLDAPLCLTCECDTPGKRPRRVVWPSLLEKGYMKLMGGYDFPGSNSSIDLHALIGWIPDHVNTRSSKREETWSRIYDGFHSGRCMVTLGTGVGPDIYWDGLKLLPSHCYAVIGVQEVDGIRTLTVLDSWVHSSDLRVLEMPWSDVLNTFDGLYLSWDPAMWHKMLIYHGKWKVENGQTSASRQIRVKVHNPNIRSNDQEIWVLLTRHVVDTRKSSEFIALNVQIEDDFAGRSVSCNTSGISNKGPYTNSPHFLTRLSIPPLQSSGTLSISALYDGSSSDVGFSLTVYAGVEIEVEWVNQNVLSAPFTETVSGSLTSKNSGGNSTHPTFMINPQYHLRIFPSAKNGAEKTKVVLTMKAIKDIPVQVMVVWSNAQRVFEPSEKEIVATSGRHSYGFARLVEKLSPGDYNVILSAFEPHHTGEYSLIIDSSLRFSISPIPQEGAGMFNKMIRGAWGVSNAMGAPSFHRYFDNPVYELGLKSQASVKVRLQLVQHSSNVAVNVTIYSASDSPSTDRHVATSGAYDDARSGVVTPQTNLSKGRWWIVPSTYNPGVQATFQLIVYSTAPIEVQPRPRKTTCESQRQSG